MGVGVSVLCRSLIPRTQTLSPAGALRGMRCWGGSVKGRLYFLSIAQGSDLWNEVFRKGVLLKMVSNRGQELVRHKLAHGMPRQDFVFRQHRIQIRQAVEGYRLHSGTGSPGKVVCLARGVLYADRDHTSLFAFCATAFYNPLIPPRPPLRKGGRGGFRTYWAWEGDTTWQALGGKNILPLLV